MTRCRAPIRTTPACADRPAEPVTAAAGAAASTGCASRSPAAISSTACFPEAVAGGRARRQGARRRRARSRFPEAARARAAAYVITTTEGAALHLDRLRQRADDFDPAVRDRLIAGAMVPAPLVDRRRRNSAAGIATRCWSCSRRSTSSSRRRRPAPRRRSGRRPSCSTASKCRCAPISASTPSRSPSSACRWWRCRFRLSRCRSACRSSPRPGARTSRCGSPSAGTAGVVAAPQPPLR